MASLMAQWLRRASQVSGYEMFVHDPVIMGSYKESIQKSITFVHIGPSRPSSLLGWVQNSQ